MRIFHLLFLVVLELSLLHVQPLHALQCCSTHEPLGEPQQKIQELTSAQLRALEEGPKAPDVETSQSGIQLSGRVDAGYLYNFTPAGSQVRGRFFATDAEARGDFNFYALTLELCKPLPSTKDWAAGFDVELAIGEDSIHPHHHEDHDEEGEENFMGSDALHLHQAYAMFRTPIGNGLEAKVGKFHAPLGYECCPVRSNQLHITRSHVALAEPEHLIGVGLEYPLTPEWLVGGTLSNPQDVDNGLGIDASSDEYAFTGYIAYSLPQTFTLRAGVYWAPWGDSGFGMQENESAWVMDLCGEWRPRVGEGKWLLAWDAIYAHFGDFAPEDSSNFYGIALYTRYQLTDVFSLGARVDYVHTDDDNILHLGDGRITEHHAGMIDARSSDVVGVTTTAQFDLAQDLVLRVEYRVDLGDDIVNTTAQKEDSSFQSRDMAHTLALEVTYRF